MSAGSARMARLLLSFGSLLSLLSLPACVIPVAPDFQDPVAPPGGPPYFYSSTPSPGATVTMTNPDISVTPAAPDAQETVHVRWIANYPEDPHLLVSDVVIGPAATPQAVRPPTHLHFGCQLVNQDPGTQWLIMAVLSDSEFPVTGADPTLNAAGTPTSVRTWTLLYNCPDP